MFDLGVPVPDNNLPVYVSGAVVVIGGIITGIFAVWNQRGTARSRREPTIPEIWSRLERVEKSLETERHARVLVEDALRKVRAVFIDYVDRVQRGGDNALTTAERETLEETKEKV